MWFQHVSYIKTVHVIIDFSPQVFEPWYVFHTYGVSQFRPSIFQVPICHMLLVAAILDHVALEFP